jgi:hypothetical protein
LSPSTLRHERVGGTMSRPTPPPLPTSLCRLDAL